MDSGGRQHPDRRRDRGDSQGNVHPEDPAPAVIRTAEGDHEPTERRPERRCEPDCRPEQAERPPALGSLEDLLNEPEDLWHLDAGSNTLQQPEDHENHDVRGQRAPETCESEQNQAYEEQRAPGTLVTEAPHGNQEQTEGQDVPRDDQLEFGGTGAQGLFDGGQRNVDLRQVEDCDRGYCRGYRKRSPPCGVGERDGDGSWLRRRSRIRTHPASVCPPAQ